MTIWPGDELQGDDGGRYKIERMVAYRGKQGCKNPRCTTRGDADSCFGWHCSLCDEPTSMMGHDLPACPPERGRAMSLSLALLLVGAWLLALLFAVVLCVAAGRADQTWDEARARAQERKARDDIYGEKR
jgi:hypothetical protein